MCRENGIIYDMKLAKSDMAISRIEVCGLMDEEGALSTIGLHPLCSPLQKGIMYV